jgi:glucokinase
MFQFPVLLGDIGGTNARFAILSEAGAVAALPRALTSDFADIAAAVRHALQGYEGPPPRSAIFAIAAPVESTVVAMTNAAWTIDASRIASDFGLSQVALVNDYTPVAAALAGLAEADLARLGPELPAGPGPALVLGPGTGLGVAALVQAGGRLRVISTEAGHIEFGPVNEEEAAVWPHIERVGGRVTAETLLSGPGLLRLYRALTAARGEKPTLTQPDHIQIAGQSGSNRRAAEALDWFVRLLGRYAGDLALVFGASGGVYLASGIAPRILDALARGGFRDAFDRKAPHEALMRRIPTWVITNPEPALFGLSLIAMDPLRFLFEAQRVEKLET